MPLTPRRLAAGLLSAIDRKDRLRKARDHLFAPRHDWLWQVNNVVHVGANEGDEAAIYAAHNVRVLWIEPIPAVFARLQRRIRWYPRQSAYRALCADQAGLPFTLQIAVNGGKSSSIFDLSGHKDIWPDIHYTGRIELISETLDDILAKQPHRYDALVMDVQSAELLVLQGAERCLPGFSHIQTEAGNFDIYKGGVQSDELEAYLAARDFTVIRRDVFARRAGQTGECFDLLLANKNVRQK